MRLHLISCSRAPQIVPVRLAEPPVLALSQHDDVTLWRIPEDGSVVLRIGSATEIGVDTITIERHQLRAVWVGLRDVDAVTDDGP